MQARSYREAIVSGSGIFCEFERDRGQHRPLSCCQPMDYGFLGHIVGIVAGQSGNTGDGAKVDDATITAGFEVAVGPGRLVRAFCGVPPVLSKPAPAFGGIQARCGFASPSRLKPSDSSA